MNRKKFYSLILFVIALSPVAVLAQRTIYDLNGDWQFTEEWVNAREVHYNVDLPHTWNLDAMAARPDYVRSSAGYVKMCDIPKTLEGKTIYIKFYGASQKSDFFVNSKHVGTHCSGYTAFAYDITNLITYGAQNALWLRVNNNNSIDQMPIAGDFNVYGGLHRKVELIAVPATHIEVDRYATNSVYVTSKVLPDSSAEIHVEASLRLSPGDKTRAVVSLIDASGFAIDSVEYEYRTGRLEETIQKTDFRIETPHMWNGVSDPYMYSIMIRLDSEVRSGSNVQSTYDEVKTDFGIRVIEVDDNNHLLLNGNPYEIHGVCRYEDWPGYGSALKPIHNERDFQLMDEMGVNAVRLVHYPQSDDFLTMCDKNGILVWSEIPFVGPSSTTSKGFVDSEQFKSNGKLQLTEMIYQQYNHPSVILLGLFSELILRGDNPVGYISELNSLAKRLDPSKLTVASSVQDGEINEQTDLIGFNQSFGWGDGDVEDISEWGKGVRNDFPNLRVALSAYGAGGSIFQQSNKISKPDSKGNFHPEQWQTYFHENYWKSISSSKNFWGTFVDCMFDHSSAGRRDGAQIGLDDKGLVTYDRLDRKDAFYFYKANWNHDDMFIHFADFRQGVVSQSDVDIKIFSNENTISLFQDGEHVGDVNNDGYGTFRWNKLSCSPGIHTFKAVGENGDTEYMTLTVVPNADKL